MKAVCEGIYLSDAVLKVVKACASKTTLPIMECIKLVAKNDSLILSATDGEISITKRIKAEIYEEGEICVPGKYFADFIKKLEGVEITLNAYDKKMEIVYGDSISEMQILSAEDFPKVNIEVKEKNFVIENELFKKIITGATFCCATDDTRPILKGCQLVIKDNTLTANAIDGFRLATYTGKLISSTGDFEIVCPARTLNEIEKMLPAGEGEITVYVQLNHVLVEVEDTVLTSRLYLGDYIKKENIIPKNYLTIVEVDKNELKASIERAAILVRTDKNSIIILDVSANNIEITSNSEIGNVQESVKASVEGKDIKIAMNSKYITDAINALEEDRIKISFNSEIQPFICENIQNKDCLYLILPVRTSNNA